MRTVLLIAALLGAPAYAQGPWQAQASGTASELRGLSVVNAQVAWASGAKGTVLRTVDGAAWQALSVPGAEQIDFRDIQAFDANTAVIMGAGPGAASRIYRTTDGGATWKLAITNPDADGFWDAIAFWDAKRGVLMGDPVQGRFQIYLTTDGGASWTPVTDGGLAALAGEGAFAASGTCLVTAGDADAWFATGSAAQARVFHSADGGRTWKAAVTPIPAAVSTKGVFSVGFQNPRIGIAVGGDYKQAVPDDPRNGARTDDGGASWQEAPVLPAGFMSVVAPVPGTRSGYVAAGLAGSGYSADGGLHWTVLDRTPVNTVAFASPAVGWAVGPKGLVMKYVGAPLANQSNQ